MIFVAHNFRERDSFFAQALKYVPWGCINVRFVNGSEVGLGDRWVFTLRRLPEKSERALERWIRERNDG